MNKASLCLLGDVFTDVSEHTDGAERVDFGRSNISRKSWQQMDRARVIDKPFAVDRSSFRPPRGEKVLSNVNGGTKGESDGVRRRWRF